MKQWGISLLIIAASILIGLGLALFLVKKFGPETPGSNPEENVEVIKAEIPKGEQFIWGAHAGAYALNKKVDKYSPQRAGLEVSKAKDLGINLVRANLETNISYKPKFSIKYADKDNDDYINQLTSAGLDVLLVLDPDIPKTISKADYFAEGYSLGSYAAKRYKGKVNYYQLANEVSGTIAKPEKYSGETFKGDSGIEYSKERYDVTLNWLKGLAKGIRENNPEAKIVVSGHWVAYDIFGKLLGDGADFDIIGWAWYSSDGTDVTAREYNYGQRFNLAEKLAIYKKDLWIVESNRDGGSYGKNGEKEQADFFSKILQNIYSTNLFKGFIVFTLFDNVVAGQTGNPQDGTLGIVKVEEESGEMKIKSNKKTFGVYQNFISSHLKLPTALLKKPSQ